MTPRESGLRQEIEKMVYYVKDENKLNAVLAALEKTIARIKKRRDELENKASEMMMVEPPKTISIERVVVEKLIDELDKVLKALDSEEGKE